MGNPGSLQGPYADVELPTQDPPLVAVDQRFVHSEITRLRFKETFTSSKNLSYKDVTNGSTMFRTGPHKELQTLLDADKRPVVHIATKESVKAIYYVYRPDTSATTERDQQPDDSELLQVYVQQGAITKTGYLDTTLRVDFTNLTTGERCKIEMLGEWRSRTAILWLEQGSQRTALAKIYKISATTMRSDFDLKIAPNADVALVLLVCAIVDDDLKRSRVKKNKIDRKRIQPGWAVA